MKKLITLLSILIFGISSAQEVEKKFTEIKLNALSTFLGTVDVEFERTLNSKSSIGLSLFSKFNDSGDAFSYDYDGGITGFYRYYLGEKHAQGLFFEGFGMFHNTKYFVNNQADINNNFLIGLGLGYKWISKKGIIVQANFSPGVNLLGDDYDSTSGKAGISIGYRF